MVNPLDLFDQRLMPPRAANLICIKQCLVATTGARGIPTLIVRNIAQHFVMEHHFISVVATQTRQGSFAQVRIPKTTRATLSQRRS
jgi:hypothetical protein